MTPEEINKAIAKEIGYYVIQDDSGSGYRLCHPTRTDIRYSWHDYEAEAWADCDEYFSDLNACAEMERETVDFDAYSMWLERVMLRAQPAEDRAGRYIWHATAPQRCEAFLRTKGLWR